MSNERGSSSSPSSSEGGKDPERAREAELATRLRNAREETGLTQEEAAARVGLGRQALSDIERGRRRVTATELFSFAQVYGKPFEWFLAREESAEEVEEEAVFLRATELPDEGREALRHFLLRCREFAGLEELAGERTPSVAEWQRGEGRIARFEDCWDLAEKERRSLGLGVAPGNELQEALEEVRRVKVFFADLPETISAAGVLSKTFGPGILINRRHPDGRRTWSLAHEYFHLLTFGRVEGNGGPQRNRTCRAASPGEKKPKEERFADQFAAALLLPDTPVRERFRAVAVGSGKVRWEDLVRIAVYFRVSTEALLWRLANLGLFSKEVPEAYRANPEGPGQVVDRQLRASLREPEPRSSRLEAIAVRLYVTDQISGGRLAEVLGRDRADVEEVVRDYRPPSNDVGEFTCRPA